MDTQKLNRVVQCNRVVSSNGIGNPKVCVAPRVCKSSRDGSKKTKMGPAKISPQKRTSRAVESREIGSSMARVASTSLENRDTNKPLWGVRWRKITGTKSVPHVSPSGAMTCRRGVETRVGTGGKRSERPGTCSRRRLERERVPIRMATRSPSRVRPRTCVLARESLGPFLRAPPTVVSQRPRCTDSGNPERRSPIRRINRVPRVNPKRAPLHHRVAQGQNGPRRDSARHWGSDRCAPSRIVPKILMRRGTCPVVSTPLGLHRGNARRKVPRNSSERRVRITFQSKRVWVVA